MSRYIRAVLKNMKSRTGGGGVASMIDDQFSFTMLDVDASLIFKDGMLCPSSDTYTLI